MTDVEHRPQSHIVQVILEEETTKEVPSGHTPVPQLKAELGVAPDVTLWRVGEGGRKHPLGDDDVVEVREGERFEAIKGGGVS
jgi:hypothetical protein